MKKYDPVDTLRNSLVSPLMIIRVATTYSTVRLHLNIARIYQDNCVEIPFNMILAFLYNFIHNYLL